MNTKNTLFKNAKIFTGKFAEAHYEKHSALLVIDNTIAKMGSYEECFAFSQEHSKAELVEIDCKNNTLLPGFIDAHNHITLLGAALRAPKFNYPEVSKISDVLEVVKKAASERKKGQWIRGWGLDYGKFPNAVAPTRFELDTVSPDHPVAIVHYTGHYVLVNSKALELAGIDDTVKDPEGGRFLRDAEGRLNGIAQDAAQQLVVPTVVNVKHHGPDIGYITPIDELVDDIECASKSLLQYGVTAVVEPQLTAREMDGLLHALKRKKLCVRTVGMFLSNHLDEQIGLGIKTQFGNDMLSIGPIKYYCDGAIVGGTASFTEPLNNRDDNYCGSLYWSSKEEFTASLEKTHRHGLQFGIHTQGDHAHDVMLDSVEAVLEKYPRENHRHRIEHSGYPREDQVQRIAKYGMIPITQPGQLREAGTNLIDNYGEKRAKRIYPLREFLDNGIPAVISSDAFVQSHNPFSSIYGAVERLSETGIDLGKDQRITLAEAIKCHTYNAAYSFFWEDKIGTLEEGKLADIVLLQCDLLTQKAREILDIKVEMTMIDGEIAYKAH